MQERLEDWNDLIYWNHLDKVKNYTDSNYVRVCYEIAEMGSYLQKKNINFAYAVSFLDKKTYISKIIRDKIDYVCILTRYFTEIRQYREIVDFIRNEDPSVSIVVGSGFFVNALKKLEKANEFKYFFYAIDADYYINKFEFSHEFSRIVQAHHREAQLRTIHNIYYKYNGRYHATYQEKAPISRPVKLVDWSRFESLIGPVTALKTTISCPLHCSFCAVKSRTEQYQLLDIESIRQEILDIKLYNATSLIFFVDETINLPRQRFKKLLEMFIALPTPIRWCSFINISYLDEEIVSLMQKSGCIAVLIGFESGSDNILRYMNKQTTVSVMSQNHRLLKKYGILTYGFFIFGFPGETDATVQQTIDFIELIRPTFYKIHKWSCELGTAIWEQRERWKLEYKNGNFYHATMNSDQAEMFISQAYRAIKKSICIEHTDFLLTLQLYLDGVSLKTIRQLIEAERGKI